MPTTNPRRERMVRFAIAAIAVAASLIGAHGQRSATPVAGLLVAPMRAVHADEACRCTASSRPATRFARSIRRATSQLASQYNVTQIPCFVMLVNGQEFERQVGATSSESMQQMFERAKDGSGATSQKRTRDQSPDPSAPAQREMPPPNAASWSCATARRTKPGRRRVRCQWKCRPGTATPAAGNAASASHAALLSATVRLIVEDANGPFVRHRHDCRYPQR